MGVLAIDPKDDDATSAIRDASDHRFLVLRDIQLQVPQGATPDKLASNAQPADWISGDKYDTQACRQASNPWTKVTTGLGYCSHPEVYTYDPNQPSAPPYDPNHDLAWLFTINGQMGPTITVDPGRRQVWRIANTTATVTYLLDLVDGSGAEQTLQLLTLDGVVAGTADLTAPGKVHPTVSLTRILLMPAARAEVVVNNSNEGATDAVYTLRTLGFETGGANQPITGDPNDPVAQHSNYVGDPWPAIDLARVVFKASPKAASMDELLAATFTRSSSAQLHAETLATPVLTTEPVGCVTKPSLDTRRLITFDEDLSSFYIGSAVVDSNGNSIDPGSASDPDWFKKPSPHTIPPVSFEHAAPPFLMRHVCARLGEDEVWEIDNRTNELHNFHIHQTKFRLARPGDKGLPPNFQIPDALQDPASVVSGQVPGFGAVKPAPGVDVWHDTIPVPPASFVFNENTQQQELQQVGKAFVVIPFEDPVQVGSFVFHCHILEHEDKGMMAVVEVFDPAHPDKARQGADAGKFLRTRGPNGRDTAFCGKPPKSYNDLASLYEFRSQAVRFLVSPRRVRFWRDALAGSKATLIGSAYSDAEYFENGGNNAYVSELGIAIAALSLLSDGPTAAQQKGSFVVTQSLFEAAKGPVRSLTPGNSENHVHIFPTVEHARTIFAAPAPTPTSLDLSRWANHALRDKLRNFLGSAQIARWYFNRVVQSVSEHSKQTSCRLSHSRNRQ